MTRSQNRYISGASSAQGTGTEHINAISYEQAVNVHGLRVEFGCESEAEEGNSNGFWVVYALPGNIIAAGDFPKSFSDLDDEDIQNYIWGMGTWMASNQTPFSGTFTPKTSRNLPRNGRVVLQVFVDGTLPLLTNTRIVSLMTAFSGV